MKSFVGQPSYADKVNLWIALPSWISYNEADYSKCNIEDKQQIMSPYNSHRLGHCLKVPDRVCFFENECDTLQSSFSVLLVFFII